MIKYSVLTDELLMKLEGYGFHHENGIPKSNDDEMCQSIIDDYTLDHYKTFRINEVATIARDLRDNLMKLYSPAEMASWSIKMQEATLYEIQGETAVTPMLSVEANVRGIHRAELVSKVKENASLFYTLEAALGGTDGKHRDAIKALSTFQEVKEYDIYSGWPGV